MYLYGDIEAGFRYEERRNAGFVATGAEHRHGTSVFQFSDPTVHLKSGRPARCTLVAFVDDHFILGHPQVSRRLAALLEGRNEYKEPFRPLALGALEPALGLEFRFNLTSLCVTLSITQKTMDACGRGDLGRSSPTNSEKVLNTRTPRAMLRAA